MKTAKDSKGISGRAAASLEYGRKTIMPVTYNALIRYKTINSCLYGGIRRWSIDELNDACTATLAEAAGRHARVSERTIRNDIRIMRSDILGLNAPIRQKAGLYYYDDPNYSIESCVLTDSGIIGRLIKMLLDLRKKINNPELESLLTQMLPLASPESIQKIDVKNTLFLQTNKSISKQYSNYNHVNWRLSSHFDDALEELLQESEMSMHIDRKRNSNITWGRILDL